MTDFEVHPIGTGEVLRQLRAERESLTLRVAELEAASKPEPKCRQDGRCQYAIDHGAEGLGHCPPGKCAMPDPQDHHPQCNVNAFTRYDRKCDCFVGESEPEPQAQQTEEDSRHSWAAALADPEPQAQAGEPRPWDHINDVLPVLVAAANGKWSWVENTECKYIELRIDMRDGGCIIKNRRGERITPEQIAKQPWKQGGVPWGKTPTTDHSHRESIAKKDAALQACVERMKYMRSVASFERNGEIDASIQQAEEARK